MTTVTDRTLQAVTEAEEKIKQRVAATANAEDVLAQARRDADALVEEARERGTRLGAERVAEARRDAERQATLIRTAAASTSRALRDRAAGLRKGDVVRVLAVVLPPARKG